MKTSFFFVFLLICSLIKGQQNLKVEVNKGDALISIFNKYQLNDFICNETVFLNLNKLDNKELILSGLSYSLPIKVYNYNGKSIRSTIGIDDWDIAKKIEVYNLSLENNSIKKDNYKTGELWVPFHLTSDCSFPKPINNNLQKPLNYSIFGKDNQLVTIVDNALENQVYYLVSGHGGPDPGAIGKYNNNSLCEDEYSYDITLRLAKDLISHGAMVYLIIRDSTDGIRPGDILECDKDETCWKEQTIPLNQNKRLKQRSNMVNELYLTNKTRYKKQYLIVIHIDSQSKSKRADMFFYHHAKSKIGKSLANQLHKTIKGQYKLHQKGRGYTGTVTTRDLHMIRESHPATVYIELGNIMNTQDQKRFIMESNRQAVADWLTLGILKN
jgi:N-acetylmuramoyl-L-alanine amidase